MKKRFWSVHLRTASRSSQKLGTWRLTCVLTQESVHSCASNASNPSLLKGTCRPMSSLTLVKSHSSAPIQAATRNTPEQVVWKSTRDFMYLTMLLTVLVWWEALHLLGWWVRKGFQRKRKSSYSHENSQWPKTFQVWLRWLWIKFHNSRTSDWPQEKAFGRETLHLWSLQWQIHEIKHSQDTHEETHWRATLQVRKMW